VFNGAVLTRRPVLLLALVFVAALINLPLAHHAWTDYRLDSAGLDVTADVVRTEAVPDERDARQFFVTFRMPRDADPERREFVSEVDRPAYDRARSTRTISVEYLQGSPNANRVAGSVERRIGLWMTLMGDLALLVILGLMLTVGRGRRDGLVLLADADPVRCPPGGAVEAIGQDEYVVRGEVVRIADGEVVLDTGGGRQVTVVLGDFVNPAGYQQPVEVRGRALPQP
jgi:hypothetical protein